MADNDNKEIVETSEGLQKVVHFAFDEAKTQLSDTGEIVPFTVLFDDTDMFVETQPGDSMEECITSAGKTVDTAASAIAGYVVCYDGYIEDAEGRKDCIIVEGADRDVENCNVFGVVYTPSDEGITFSEDTFLLDSFPSLFVSEAVNRFRGAQDEGDGDGIEADE